MKTVCLYTRKHSDGGRRERYLENTNTNRARKFATIDGEVWTNRGLMVGDPEISTAEHEKPHHTMLHSIRITGPNGTFSFLAHKDRTSFPLATARRYLAEWQARFPSREAFLIRSDA